MKIAIPTTGGQLAAHFGHCDQFAIVEVDPEKKTIVGTTFLTPPPHEPGVLPRWLHEQGANVIIAGGMGQRAQMLFAEQNIQVLVGAASDTPEATVSAYLEGSLVTGGNLCDH
ncbi:MAG TPA: NifB/NifX family molybdenum-iron cluster-binding protein [Candidatus Hydrogenedentes bacterium]|jgi:predicted Fe-Mo cluster-binding NifX family protein|nr:NifB/NifX family molybdenum-iron cluster-binding protein [Candidatus Hydrogenedentota bacterium]